MSKNRDTKYFRQWIAQYTNGNYADYTKLPATRQNELWESYLVDRKDAWGEPCGSGLINIKPRVNPTKE